MSGFLLRIFSIVVLLGVFLWGDTFEDYATVRIAKYDGKAVSYESNRSRTRFRDINVTFKLLKTQDAALDIERIAEHDVDFKPLHKDEMLNEDNVTYWLRVDLGERFPSGRFLYSYGDATIAAHTIAPRQQAKIFRFWNMERLEFTYDRQRDARVYYFRLTPRHYRIPFKILTVSTVQAFFTHMSKEIKVTMLVGLILGLILMAAIYNGAMYYYNRDKAFLYYALMQLFMVLVLFDYSGFYFWDEHIFIVRNITYQSLIGLLASVWATFFTMRFLRTRTYTPRLHTFLRIALGLLAVDMIISLFDASLLLRYHLLPFFVLFFLYAAYRRIRQGYKPAYYYLAGWFMLGLALALDSFQIGYEHIVIQYLYLGAAAEAILFSLALSARHRIAAKEREQQRQLLVHQSRLASMGEMLGNIAHQWRQPLTHLSYTLMNVHEAHKHGELTPEYLENKIDEANTQLTFMSETIDDFRDFFAPDKSEETFGVEEATRETLELMHNSLRQYSIAVTLDAVHDAQLHSSKNAYKHVLLNLLANARDALAAHTPPEPAITITIDHNTVTLTDNGGGIPPEVLPRIFEPYFSTRQQGTGIGLYMSRMIIRRDLGGELNIENTGEGVRATITFPVLKVGCT